MFSESKEFSVYGTARGDSAKRYFSNEASANIICGVDVGDHDSITAAFARVQPDVVINCIGLVKQLADANDPLVAVPINTLLPHRLASLCAVACARLIHVSTDCVFSGSKGNYSESDFPDAYDLYGRSKFLGEVDYPNAITLRTSIIGHELSGARSLVGWFLAQCGSVKGFSKAIFSGLPTVELARVVRDFVLPNPALTGLYHVAASPICKLDLLRLVAKAYEKETEIVPNDSLVIDRSLNPEKFRLATGYVAPEWPDLVRRMAEFK
ncbi:MAG: SDR family oxidoreductase [Candidatus Moraniibacteriota bacterium]|nr:MAG: SDR family oxidoreductase [Candidatus Moranbacteria bacterium]